MFFSRGKHLHSPACCRNSGSQQTNSMIPAITIVLTTYGRPSTLVCAVQSVLQQTVPNWQLLVIGDGCGEETATAVAPFLADPRICYVNLPWRCGEQALPNSAGMACATTARIALLNHDDLWLPSHLETACRQLDQTGADFFFGRSAWIWDAPENADAPLTIKTISPLLQSFEQMFVSGLHAVEPASAWVFSRELAEKVGPWRSAGEIYRAPIQEWALRACRYGARVTAATEVTCFKFENQWSAGAASRRYDTPALPQQATLRMLQDPIQLQALKRHLHELANRPETAGHRMELSAAPVPGPRALQLTQQLITPNTAALYLQTGLDAYTWLCTELGLPRGWRWKAALKLRTGETEITPPSPGEVTAHVARSVVGWPQPGER